MQSDDNAPYDQAQWPEAQTYFDYYTEGRYDRVAEFGYIYSCDRARVSQDGERLYIGRAGTNGIEFVYRKGSPEIWAYYPIDGDYDVKSESIEQFEIAWRKGEIRV